MTASRATTNREPTEQARPTDAVARSTLPMNPDRDARSGDQIRVSNDVGTAEDGRGQPWSWPAYAPSFFPELDVSGVDSVADLEEIINRDFAAKAPTASDVTDRIASGGYGSRYDLLRDVTRYLYWAHRQFLTLYTLRPCRWEDLPTDDPEARLPVVTRSDAASKLAKLIATAFEHLPSRWPGNAEGAALRLLLEPLASVGYDAARMPCVLPSLDMALSDTQNVALRVHSVRYLGSQMRREQVLALNDPQPELTALLRQAGALVCEHVGRWGLPELAAIGSFRNSDFVLVCSPRSSAVAALLAERNRRTTRATTARSQPRLGATARVRYSPSRGVRIAGLAGVKGERVVSNADIVANSAWHWSPMSSADIFKRTGIRERRYTERTLDELAGDAALQVLAHAGDLAANLCGVVACSSTNPQPIPSFAARIADVAGLTQLGGVWDVTAACSSLPYGLMQAAAIVEQTESAVLLVLAEKFSDKLGTVRSSRMLFGDGAAAVLLAPAADGPGDLHLVQTYAGGTCSEVCSGRWPDPAFNNHLVIDGPSARKIVERYVQRILLDLRAEAAHGSSPFADIDLIIPHQANEPMIREIALAAGIPTERLYFNVSQVGNTSSASIPLAIHDAICDGTITDEVRVLAPAFAIGALAGVVAFTVRPSALAGGPLCTHAVDIARCGRDPMI